VLFDFLEAFGSNTTNVLTPIKLMHYAGVNYELPLDAGNVGKLTKELSQAITDIQVLIRIFSKF
jgi:branched-subunit amino acid aminotransferase/4-amino-4-deoxychorismate lyase